MLCVALRNFALRCDAGPWRERDEKGIGNYDRYTHALTLSAIWPDEKKNYYNNRNNNNKIREFLGSIPFHNCKGVNAITSVYVM